MDATVASVLASGATAITKPYGGSAPSHILNIWNQHSLRKAVW
jgi:hypothetical protein